VINALTGLTRVLGYRKVFVRFMIGQKACPVNTGEREGSDSDSGPSTEVGHNQVRLLAGLI